MVWRVISGECAARRMMEGTLGEGSLPRCPAAPGSFAHQREVGSRGLVAIWVFVAEFQGMNRQVKGLRVASIVFGLLAVAQLLRLILRVEILVDGRVLPLWVSMIACPVLAVLSIWLWSLSSKP